MVVFKRKQIVVLSLVLMIVVAGYLQYSYKKSSVSASVKETGKLGEAVYVDNKDVGTKQQNEDKNKVDQKDTAASNQTNDYFAQAKLDKEVSRSKEADALKQITEDTNAESKIKANAYDKMMLLVDNSDKEMRIETLLKNKGFKDALALFGDDGSLDIIIKASSLSSTDTAQIADIVSRQAKVEIEKLHIRSVN